MQSFSCKLSSNLTFVKEEKNLNSAGGKIYLIKLESINYVSVHRNFRSWLSARGIDG